MGNSFNFLKHIHVNVCSKEYLPYESTLICYRNRYFINLKLFTSLYSFKKLAMDMHLLRIYDADIDSEDYIEFVLIDSARQH